MGTQQLPVIWKDYQKEILKTFQQHLLNGLFVDVTLACEGASLKAHKMILSACSPFFQNLFLENTCQHPIVIMKDVKYRNLKSVIDFMYFGIINISHDELSDFLRITDMLKVKGVSNIDYDTSKFQDTDKQIPSLLEHIEHSHSPVVLREVQTDTQITNKCKVQKTVLSADINCIDNENGEESVQSESFNIKKVKLEPTSCDDNLCVFDSSDHHSLNNSFVCHQKDQISAMHSSFVQHEMNLVDLKCNSGDSNSKSLLKYQQNDSKSKNLLTCDTNVPMQDAGQMMEFSTSSASLTTVEQCQFNDEIVIPDYLPSIHSASNIDNDQDMKPIVTPFEKQHVSTYSQHQEDHLSEQSTEKEAMLDDTGYAVADTSINPYDEATNEAFLMEPLAEIATKSISYIDTSDLSLNKDGDHNYAVPASTNHKSNSHLQPSINLVSSYISRNDFSTHNQLTKHHKTHSFEKHFTCGWCCKKFKQKSSLKIHLTQHIDFHNCTICNTIFLSSSQLLEHMKLHNSKKTKSCDKCHKEFVDDSELDTHMQSHNPGDVYPFVCNICKEAFVLKSDLQTHLSTHLGENHLSDTSDEIFQTQHFDGHASVTTNEELRSCDACGDKYMCTCNAKSAANSVSDLLPSSDNDKSKDSLLLSKAISCSTCESKTLCTCIVKSISNSAGDSRKNKFHLMLHKPISCDKCGKKFMHRREFLRHVIIHSDEKAYSCELCHKRFNRKDNLKTHMAIHTGDRPFQCVICNKTFTTNSLLRTHMKLHMNEKAFVCDLCEKEFSKKKELISHKITHRPLKEYPYACNLCDRRFEHNNSLTDHIRKHTGDKPFLCEVCGVSFPTIRNLKRHKKLIHTKEKPFACDICNRKFGVKCNLYRHLKLLHSMKET